MEKAKVYNQKMVIPTYGVGKEDKNPMFFEKRVYQGSSGKVYPNPVKEKVFVEADGPCSWSIYDTLGKFLAAGKLSGTPGEYIYVENLAPGYYILTVSSEKGTSSIQLVK